MLDLIDMSFKPEIRFCGLTVSNSRYESMPMTKFFNSVQSADLMKSSIVMICRQCNVLEDH